MRKILACVLVTVLLVLLAFALSLAITPATAISEYEEKLPCDDGDDELTKAELSSAILPYMLGEDGGVNLKLDDVGDAAYIYAYWDGKPRTFKDSYDRTVTFYRPIERIIAISPNNIKTVIALASDNLVALTSGYGRGCVCSGTVGSTTLCAKVCGGRYFELPLIGPTGGCPKIGDLELVISLEPDLIIGKSRSADATQDKTGIPTVAMRSSGHNLDTLYKEIEVMGVLLEKEGEAKELISFVKEKVDKLEEVTSQIPEEKKPRVYIATRGHGSSMGGFIATTGRYDPLDIAGGINVAKGTSGTRVLKEQIIDWNPDIIIIAHSFGSTLDEMNDVERTLLDPDLQTINAVKNERVYFTLYPYCCGTPQDRNIVAAFYLAKLLHPDKSEDLDVEKEGNEIMEAFLGVDGLFSEYADDTIWLREYLDEQQKT